MDGRWNSLLVRQFFGNLTPSFISTRKNVIEKRSMLTSSPSYSRFDSCNDTNDAVPTWSQVFYEDVVEILKETKITLASIVGQLEMNRKHKH